MAIASQSLRNTDSLEHGREAIESRLLALGRVHDLLLKKNWTSASLASIVQTAIEPFDKGANIFDAPGGRPRSDLDRLGITPVAHALPPSGFADRNNGRDWRLLVRIADDLGKAQVADFGQFVHVGSLRSKLR